LTVIVAIKLLLTINWQALSVCMTVDGTGGGSVNMPDDYGSRQPSGGSYSM